MRTKFILPCLLLLFATFAPLHAQSKTEIHSKLASAMLHKDRSIKVLDVRTAEEFNSGHIKGAINIDIRASDAFSKINKLNRNQKYIVHCYTHHRSGMAVDQMQEAGFKTIYQMMDGFSGWEENNLPIQK